MLKQSFPETKSSQLRPMELNRDLLQVADLISLCFADSLDEDGFRFVNNMREAANSSSVIGTVQKIGLPRKGFVWEENNKIVGNVSVVNLLYHNVLAYLIANVAVHPDYRKQGIAKKLTIKTLDFIRARKIPHVFLQVNMNNPVALKLYQNFGFEEIAMRTTWHAFPDKNLEINLLDNYSVMQQSPKEWGLQKQWLSKVYPRTITWHLPYKEQLLRPGIIAYINRLLGDHNLKQWSVYKDRKLVGSLSWQSSNNMADWLWLGVDQNDSDLAISTLLMHARKCSKAGRLLAVNYPTGMNTQTFTDCGFKHHHTLIWMKLKI